MRRLRAQKAVKVVRLDHSINEVIETEEVYALESDGTLLTYSLEDLVAEKLRATLQQKQEARGRTRRQDIYDLHFLLRTAADRFDDTMRARVLEVLLRKAHAREIFPAAESLQDPEIRERSALEYGSLALEIDEPLPAFESAFAAVRTLYESLPWGRIKAGA